MTSTGHGLQNKTDCDHHALSSSYLELLLRHDAENAVVLLLNAVHDGLPLKELYLKVLQPTQYELGRLSGAPAPEALADSTRRY